MLHWKTPIILLIALAVSTAVLLFPQAALAQNLAPVEPYTGIPVCLPDAYLVSPSDCLPLGPSETLTALEIGRAHV
jgi:hypothetical protein